MIIAYKRHSFGKRSYNPTIIESDLNYFEKSYCPSRSMGTTTWKAHRMVKAGVVPDKFSGFPQEIDDIRIVSPESAKIIRQYDTEIAALQAQRMSYIKDNFRTWQIPDKDDCTKVIDGKSRQEVEATVRAKNKDKPNSQAIAVERQVIKNINKTFRRQGIK